MEVSIMNQRKYDPEFKKETVRLVVEKGRTAGSVAKDLGISKDTVYGWVKQFKQHQEVAFPGKGRLNPDDEEVRQLKRRILDLEEENNILKKATAIFARPQK